MLNKCIRRYFFSLSSQTSKEAKKKIIIITPDLRLVQKGIQLNIFFSIKIQLRFLGRRFHGRCFLGRRFQDRCFLDTTKITQASLRVTCTWRLKIIMRTMVMFYWDQPFSWRLAGLVWHISVLVSLVDHLFRPAQISAKKRFKATSSAVSGPGITYVNDLVLRIPHSFQRKGGSETGNELARKSEINTSQQSSQTSTQKRLEKCSAY